MNDSADPKAFKGKIYHRFFALLYGTTNGSTVFFMLIWFTKRAPLLTAIWKCLPRSQIWWQSSLKISSCGIKLCCSNNWSRSWISRPKFSANFSPFPRPIFPGISWRDWRFHRVKSVEMPTSGMNGRTDSLSWWLPMSWEKDFLPHFWCRKYRRSWKSLPSNTRPHPKSFPLPIVSFIRTAHRINLSAWLW